MRIFLGKNKDKHIFKFCLRFIRIFEVFVIWLTYPLDYPYNGSNVYLWKGHRRRTYEEEKVQTESSYCAGSVYDYKLRWR